MTQATLKVVEGGIVKVQGPLTFNSILPLLAQGEQILSTQQTIVFDMQAVTQSDSAGLSLLIAWLRMAKKVGCAIQFKNIPLQLAAIVKVCGLEKIVK